jgi:hypothetical protein
MKFKVGDQVRYTATNVDFHNLYGKVLDSKETGANGVNVEFEKKPREGGWWCDERTLELVKEDSKMAEKDDSRGLYNVIVVNPSEEGEVILDEKIVAKDEGEAKFLSNVKQTVKDKNLKIGNVDVIVKLIDKVRPYETEQKVRIVGSVDGFSLVKKA